MSNCGWTLEQARTESSSLLMSVMKSLVKILVYIGLLFFHAFTGCDSTASFYEKTKVQFFNSWFEHSSMLNDVFKKLSWSPSRKCVEESLAVLEEFVTKLYSKSPASRSVDEDWFNLFANPVNDNFRKIPPTQDALLNHTLRSAYQAGWVWGNTLKQAQVPSKMNWGWTMHPDKHQLLILWVNPSEISILATVTRTCKCRSVRASCSACQCAKSKLQCLRFCSCKQNCINKQ